MKYKNDDFSLLRELAAQDFSQSTFRELSHFDFGGGIIILYQYSLE